MVREANVKQATAEKQLKEAQGKVSLGPRRGGAGEVTGRRSVPAALAAVLTGEVCYCHH